MGALHFKLTLAYDGTAYHGWQAQKSGRGVQNHLEAALDRLFGPGVACESASRTDTGVHAFGMVTGIAIPQERFRMAPGQFALALNAVLPPDIRVRSASRVPGNFHARFDATGKQYRYHVWNHPAMNPLLRDRAWHVPQPLDLAAMESAARAFVGRHDFRAFTSRRAGTLGDSVRTVTRCSVKKNGPQLTITIEGGGFLYKMCRAMVGTLVGIGRDGMGSADVAEILAGRDRRQAGMNAPAHGLVLWKVFYPSRRRNSGA